MAKKKRIRKQKLSKIEETKSQEPSFFSRDQRALIASILVLLPLTVFWQTTGFEFVWDDNAIHITGNPYFNPVTGDSFFRFWTEPYRKLYIPITYNLWGVMHILGSGKPFVFHLANVVLHILNGFLIFFLLKQFIKNQWAVLIGTLVFLVHPLQVEAVAWVSEFRGLLAGFFCFLSLYFYIQSCRIRYETDQKTSGFGFWISAWALFLCAMLSKPSAAVMPLFAIVFEYYLFHPTIKRLGRNIWPFFIPIIGIAVLTSKIQIKEAILAYPFWAKPFIWMDSISFYMIKLFFPFSLAASYARTPAFVMDQWWFYFSWVVPAGIVFCCWYFRKKYPWLILIFSLFIIGFLPVSGLIEFTFQKWSTVADRYMYLSMAGIALGIAFMASCFRFYWQWLTIVIIIFCMAGFSGFVQAKVWKNPFSLWDHNIQVSPRESIAYYNRGKIFLKRKQLVRAKSDFDRAIALNPLTPKVYNSKGEMLWDKKEYQQAQFYFNQAIDLDPSFAMAYANRARGYVRTQEYDKALADFTRAISLDDQEKSFYVNRGSVYLIKKEYENAILDFSKAIMMAPEFKEAYFNRGLAFFYMLDYQKALDDIFKSQKFGAKVDPDFLKELKIKSGQNN